MELNLTEDEGEEDKLITRLIEEAVKNVFDARFTLKQFRSVVEFFEGGKTLETGDRLTTDELHKRLEAIPGFMKQVVTLAAELEPELANGPAARALQTSLAEFLLEALHCHNRLNKKRKGTGTSYGS